MHRRMGAFLFNKNLHALKNNTAIMRSMEVQATAIISKLKHILIRQNMPRISIKKRGFGDIAKASSVQKEQECQESKIRTSEMHQPRR